MTPWQNRQTDLANLLNPAFCGFLLHEAVNSYVKEASAVMPLSICFLVLPLVLHRPTRDSFPTKVTSSFLAWLQEHPEARIEFASRVRNVAPYTRESLRFLIVHGIVTVNDGGLSVVPGNVNNTRGLQQRTINATDDIKGCISEARFLGRWFVHAPNDVTLYNILGIQP